MSLSIALAEVEAERETRVAKAGDGISKPAPKRTIGNLPEGLPRIEEVIEPASLICPCGCGIMHRIGEDRSERLDIVPAQLRVIRCPAAHVYMRERGHGAPEVCLPDLH